MTPGPVKSAIGNGLTNSGTLTFAPGVASQTFTVQTTQDSVFEGAETFTVSLSNATNGAVIGDGTGIGTIKDDGTGPGPFGPGPNADNDTPVVSIAVAPASMAEDANGVMTYTVSLSNPSDQSTVVSYSLGGTAGVGDYSTTGTGTVTSITDDRQAFTVCGSVADGVNLKVATVKGPAGAVPSYHTPSRQA